MELFRDLRLKRGRLYLENRLARMRRKRFTGNLTTAKTMALIWDATDYGQFQTISHFHQKMNERGIDMKVYSYYPDKVIPDRLTAIRYLTVIKRDELNFFYRPVSNEAQRFLSSNFDILIDINLKSVFPLQYLSFLSKSGLKVGIFDPTVKNQPFDLLLQVPKNTGITEYLEQAVHYLEMVNSDTSKKERLF
jgi:hypothetical protein